MSAYELRQDDVALSLALVIAGVRTRYVSHLGWPAAAGLTDYQAITGATPMGGTLGILGGAAEYQNVTLTLATLGAGAYSEHDPGLVLGRVDFRDCAARARLITTLPEETGTATVEVDRDPAVFTAALGAPPYHVHVGREAIQVTGTAGDGSLGNPWRFTLGSRGSLLTLPQQHYVHQVTPMRPWVTTEPFAWRWRRAWLYARARRPDGSFGDLVEVMPCFIGDAPVIDGPDVELELLPLTAILDKQLSGPGNAVRLLQGWHYFADGIACTVEHAQRAYTWSIYNELTTANSLVAGTVLDAPTGPYDLAADITLPSGHPRRTRLDAGGNRSLEPQSPHAGAAQFSLAVGLPAFAVAAGRSVVSVEDRELHQVDLITPALPGTTALLRWPVDALDLIVAAWTPGTYVGDPGAWLDVKIGDDAERGPHIQVRANVAQLNGPISLVFWSGSWPGGELGPSPESWATGAPSSSQSGLGRRRLHYGLDFGDPSDGRYPHSLRDPEGQGGAHWERLIDAGRDSALRDQYWPIRGWATAWYQSGERYILVDSDVPVPAAGEVTLAIHYSPRGGGDRRMTSCRIISSTAVGDGFALEVHPDDRDVLPSFGDWADSEPVELVPTVRFVEQSDGILLLEALHSNGGNLVTDPNFDRRGFGGGLATTDLEQFSFTRHPTPPGLDRWSLWVQPGNTLRDVIDPILQATSSALVMQRTAAGRAWLARVSLGLESAAGVTDHLERWEAAQPPANAPDNTVTNVYKLRLNHIDGALGDAAVELVYTDAASVAAHGDGEVLELELRGLYTDPTDPAEAMATFRDLVARFSAVAGSPRVRWVGRVPLGDVWTLDLGSEVLVTSPKLRGRGVAWGVTALVGRVVHISIPLWSSEATADVAIVHYGIQGTRWNAALEVTAAPTVASVTVAANAMSDTVHPLTGGTLEDLDGWSVGDDVLVRPAFDHDASTPLTILGINRTTREVTLSGAHGLAGPDWGYLEPPTRPTASVAVPPAGVAQADLAHLGDINERLNAGTQDAQDLG